MKFIKKAALTALILIITVFTCVSCAGPQGVQGEKGIDGANGKDGSTGADGKSAYEIAVDNGFTGTLEEWLLSLEGEKGDQGEPGAKGDAGEKGETGEKGDAGEKGEVGDKGDDGAKGDDGLTPYIGENGNWWIGDTDTNVKAEGKDGKGLTIKPSISDCTEVGDAYIDKTNGHLLILTGLPNTFEDVGEIKGDKGDDGLTPYIGENGNWWIGDTDTNVKAEGKDGTGVAIKPSASDCTEIGDAYIDKTTGHLLVLTKLPSTFEDAGEIKGDKGDKGNKGDKGDDGLTPHIGENGNWWIGNTDTKVKAEGKPGSTGANGKSAFELYCEIYGYSGSEEEWISDLVSGKLTTHTVTFDLNGGTAGAGYTESVKVFGGGIVDLTIPTKEGHTFIGWYTGETVNDGIFTSTTPVKEDITLIARWQVNSFAVKFIGNNGATLKYQKVNYGEPAEAPTAPTIDKLKFTGWDTDFSSVKSDLTVKSIYVSDVYTLTYNTNGGSTVAAEEYYVGDIPVKPENPTKDGYYFIGWYLDKEYTSEYKFNTEFTENTTLYAYFYTCFEGMTPISNADELKAISGNSSGKFYLTNNINLDGASWAPIYFNGILDGNNYKIHNFSISSSTSIAGFFTHNYGTIKNITFSDFSFSIATEGEKNTFNAGGIAGTNAGTIDNCHIKDAVLSYSYYRHGNTNIYNSYAGGLVGYNSGTISNCSIEAEMNGKVHVYSGDGSPSGYLWIGGITGRNSGTINNIYSTTEMSFLSKSVKCSNYSYRGTQGYSILAIGGGIGENSGNVSNGIVNNTTEVSASQIVETYGDPYPEAWIGGFVKSNSGTISECSANGSICIPTGFDRASVGGFAQENENNISNCYSAVNIDIKTNGSANNDDAVGGFVANNSGTINSCYSTGDITTATRGQVGGFVGRNASGASVSKSFSTGNITLTSTPANVGYFVGLAEGGSTLFKSYYNSAMEIKRNGVTVTPNNTDGASDTVDNLITKEMLVDTLSWNESLWSFKEGEYPTLAFEDQ